MHSAVGLASVAPLVPTQVTGDTGYGVRRRWLGRTVADLTTLWREDRNKRLGRGYFGGLNYKLMHPKCPHMRLGVVSDTHDRMVAIHAAVDLFERESVDAVIHCGDFIR